MRIHDLAREESLRDGDDLDDTMLVKRDDVAAFGDPRAGLMRRATEQHVARARALEEPCDDLRDLGRIARIFESTIAIPQNEVARQAMHRIEVVVATFERPD